MKRPLWMVVGALAGAAVALWGSSRLAWTTEMLRHPGTDATTQVTRAGGEFRPLVALAVLALAAVAGAVALGGWPRRLLAAVLAPLAGTSIGYGLIGAPGGADFFPWGRILAVLGGVLVAVAALLLVRFGNKMPRMGAAYQRTDTERSTDDSDHEMWRALSLGKDPTTDER